MGRVPQSQETCKQEDMDPCMIAAGPPKTPLYFLSSFTAQEESCTSTTQLLTIPFTAFSLES